MRSSIYFAKPLANLVDSVLHSFKIGAEHYILSCAVGHMLVKDHIKTVRFIQSTAQRFKVFFSLVTHSLVFCSLHPYLIFCKTLLIGENRKHILRRIEYSSDYRFAQSHFTCDVAVKEFISHITLIVKITDSCCRQSEQLCIGISVQKLLDTFTPQLCSGSMKLIKHNIVGLDLQKLRFC